MVATDIVLEQAGFAHARALTELRIAGLLEQQLLDPERAPQFRSVALREFHDHLRGDNFAAWVLADARHPIGAASVLLWRRLPYPGTSLHAEIGGVYVAPGYRGRGYASELVREAVDWARARGVRRVSLHASRAGRALYERLGFEAGSELRLGAAPLAG